MTTSGDEAFRHRTRTNVRPDWKNNAEPGNRSTGGAVTDTAGVLRTRWCDAALPGERGGRAGRDDPTEHQERLVPPAG